MWARRITPQPWCRQPSERGAYIRSLARFASLQFMVHPDQVRAAITQALPDARVEVEDLTGGGDHLQVTVVSTAFDGLSRVKQHQLVYGALRSELASEAIHALALQTSTPTA